MIAVVFGYLDTLITPTRRVTCVVNAAFWNSMSSSRSKAARKAGICSYLRKPPRL